jgi:DMSO reductase family type II enzyme chaperone
LYNKQMERAAVMVEVSEFYRHFGLAMNQDEDKRELPDYLCAELEFLAFLAFKQAQAAQEVDEGLLNGYLWAERDFLERHMVGWLPVFTEQLAKEGEFLFYAHLADFTIAFARAELELLNGLVVTENEPPVARR